MSIIFLQIVNNDSLHKVSNEVKRLDPSGVGLAVIGLSIVFLSLLILYLAFMNITKVLNRKLKKSLLAEGKNETEVIKELDMSAEVNAAIATALHLYFSEMHDLENPILTIKRVSRTYSPWSSKIYGIRKSLR
jgi:Na+-transporting methylmalonyl-CoA/oxaloacetate decarboxylase gamma subunit